MEAQWAVVDEECTKRSFFDVSLNCLYFIFEGSTEISTGIAQWMHTPYDGGWVTRRLAGAHSIGWGDG